MSTDSKARSFTVVKRPLTVAAAITGQFVIAAYLLDSAVFCLRNGDGLSVFLEPEVLLGVISAVALLRKGDFGWWLALISDIFCISVLVFGGGMMNWHTALSSLVPVTVVVLLLLPSVRNFYCTTDIRTIRINPS